jgi:hypothetical protein
MILMLRQPVGRKKSRQRTVKSTTVPAPVAGWDAKNPLASMPPLAAVQLKNWFPQPGWVEVRRGFKVHSSSIGNEVETLATWHGPAASAMFAAAGGSIWSVTANAAATESYAASATNDRWQWCQHTTSAGSFLVMVNGADAPIHYNGSVWAEPTITGITASDAVGVISHKKRLWFVLTGTTKGAYLGTEAVAGAASEFQFGSLFTRGGYLMALATWTRDGGSGADDYLVAVSSRGQVAVYQGTDPSSASTWSLVGVFDVPSPIGRRCFTRYGADLLLITLEGVFPLSQLLSVDQSQASRVAITDNIAPKFNDAARSYGSNFGWEVCTYAKGTRLIVNVPTSELSAAMQYVMNTITGGWCEFDSHNANCWVVYNDNLYFGGNGVVYQADTGSADVDAPITAIGQAAYNAFGGANTKRFSMIRPLVTVSATNRPSVGISTDFIETQAMSSIAPATGASAAAWDSAIWDSSEWSGTDQEVNDWANAVGLGTFGSVKFQAQTGISSGGGAWGIGLWGDMLWGSRGRSDETMRIQGFVLLYESGEYI